MAKATGIVAVCGDGCHPRCSCCAKARTCPGHPTYRRPGGGLRADRTRRAGPLTREQAAACPLIYEAPAKTGA